MKKFLTMFLVLAMVLSLGCTALAADATYNGTVWNPENGNTQNVTVTTALDGAEEPVYKVVIAWNELTFTYTAGTAQTWDADNHTYSGGTSGSWSDPVEISVENHSNVSVWATGAYNKTEDVGGVAIALTSPNSAEIVRTEAGAEDASSAVFTLAASGTPTEVVDDQVVGTVTITISKVAPNP